MDHDYKKFANISLYTSTKIVLLVKTCFIQVHGFSVDILKFLHIFYWPLEKNYIRIN